eukprot:2229707-Amphidinium_carterae.2
MTVMTHDMIKQRACVSVEIMRALFDDLCKTEGVEVELPGEWVRAFLLSIDFSFKAASQRYGPKVRVLRRIVMKIAYSLEESRVAVGLEQGKDEKAGFQRPSKQADTVTLVTSAMKDRLPWCYRQGHPTSGY